MRSKKLPLSPQMIFPKKDARIFWTLNEDQKVDNYKVYNIYSPNKAQILYEELSIRKIVTLSSGNCYSDWDEYTLEDCVLEIFKYLIQDQETLKEIFIELGKIEEWSERLSYFNGNFWGVRV